MSSTPTRRRFLGGALGAAGGLAAGGAGFGVARASESDSSSSPRNQIVPFYGAHQAGISTAAQDRLALAAFDVTSTDPQQLKVLLASWAAAASQLVQGRQIGSPEGSPEIPPSDTGEALGLSAANLTVTVGFGATLFDKRFGLARFRPAALVDLPPFYNEDLDLARSNGDLIVQACADDPVVAFHVIRNFARIARGAAVMRWSQLGFGRTASTTKNQSTERNLLGFKDGTRNIKVEDAADLDDYVWVGAETDQAWIKGGTYMVTRRIRMHIEAWDSDRLSDQEQVFGRVKDSGAPLTGNREFDTPNLTAAGGDGTLTIASDAHIRLASPSSHGGQKLLRRGYSYTDGNDPQTNLLDAGLMFIAFQKDARKQFIPIQSLLGKSDALNEYIIHLSSGIYAVPPGLTGPSDWYGKALFS